MLREHSRGVPDDVALIGYDNLEIGRFTEPPLSTIGQPIQAMAQAMVDILQRRIGGQSEQASVILPTQLVLRASG